MLNEKFTFCSKITIKWNLTKSKKRLKSGKYKIHVIKEYFLQKTGLQPNESIGWLSKCFKGGECWFLFKEE